MKYSLSGLYYLGNVLAKSLLPFRRIKFFFLRKSFNLWDTVQFIFNIGLTGGTLLLTNYYAVKFSIGERDITSKDWNNVLIASSILLVFSYMREYVNNKTKRDELKADSIIYPLISGGIEELIDLKSQDKGQVLIKVLGLIQNTVETILRQNGQIVRQVCANLMIVNNNKLELKYFGPKASGRKKIVISLDKDKDAPGAPQAFNYNKTVYIENTDEKEYSKYFNNKKYKSILCIPIESNDKVIAILNIDSAEKYQFISDRFIANKLYTRLEPFVFLIKGVCD